jgi:hypothetical protein
MPLLNLKDNICDYEKLLLINLNDENKNLNEKTALCKKAAIYLNKPYLFYLLAHFLFENPLNF